MSNLRLVWTLFLFVIAASMADAAPLLDASEMALNRPRAPFRIADEIYFVGTSDLGIYLIATPGGDILIDGGYEHTVPQILANLRTLGVAPRNIRILLNSHEHKDHAGGLAGLKRATGARLIASRAAAIQLARGGRGDFQYGDRLLFPPVRVDSIVEDGGTVSLGGVTLTAHLTPGHTKGCTTWTMQAHIQGKPYAALFLCSVSAPNYRLVDNLGYPQIASDYEHSFRILRQLPCEIFLGSHGRFFALEEKRASMLKSGSPTVFVDPAGCRRHLDLMERAFRSELAAQSK
jgi:metallo-beta-lactamase class B